MNFKKVWIITNSLLLSQLRATARNRGSVRSIIRRPRILGLLDVVAFIVVAGLVYYFSRLVIGTSMQGVFAEFAKSAVTIMPALLIAMVLLFGLIFEITSSYQFSSSDTVNWLPVTASEYVLASTLALLIYYSIIPAIMISGVFALAYTFGLMDAWVLATVLSLFGVFLSASVLEIIRAVLNRFTSSFYKRGGQAAVAVRAVFGVMILVVFQILFYPTFYTQFIGAISPNFGATWFVPILWASVSVSAFIAGSAGTSIAFGVFSILLACVLYYIAVGARSKYWVPIPAAIRISTRVYAPKSRSSILGFISTPQLAIARKDLRGLVRRKEMIRFLALPAIFLVTSVFSFSSSGASEFFVYFGVFIVGISSFFLASSSVGAEGKAIMTLYQVPVSSGDFLLGKLVTPALFGSIFGLIFFVVIGALLRVAEPLMVPVFLILALSISIELSFVGLYIGARFPNFSESPRAQYISQTAALIAFPIAALLIGIPLAPLFVATIFYSGLDGTLVALVASLVLAALVSLVFYALASGQVKKLLSQIPF
ncbi:MAG: hypothetical protein ACRECH_02270 [Nitrososphaerales archaeon]